MSISTLFEDYSQFRHRHPDGDIPHNPYKWAMAIDLDACSGCNACSVACYAENNLPVVGREKFSHGQAMHWMRIERYWDQDGREFPDRGARYLPMLCQQCEAAPCETVCPVGATNHTPDGLNSQIYNRCIGSRYCSSNCPYKVRYFNWWDYPTTDNVWPAEMNMQLNPDATVRGKGVMEKCTFCLHRTRVGRNPACLEACPVGARKFGDLNDPNSEIRRIIATKRVYILKEELGTLPRFFYFFG